METTTYHSLLRVSVVVCALALVLDSGLVHATSKELSEHTMNYMANSVGVQAEIDENLLNTSISGVANQDTAVAGSEVSIAARDIAVSVSRPESVGSTYDVSTYILSVILFILLVLIVLNYVLDYQRAREINQVNS